MYRRDFEKGNNLTVGEFSKLTGIPVSTLKFYDRKGIFQPAMRGNARQNRYRYYSPMQIITVKMILILTELGVPLDKIKELAKEREPVQLAKLLGRNERLTNNNLAFLNEAGSVIKVRRDLIIKGTQADEDSIYVDEMEEMPIIIGDVNEFHTGNEFMGAFLTFCTTPHRPALNLYYPIGGFFKNMDAFLGRPSLPTRFFSLDPKGHERIEKRLYLVGYTRGYYGQTNDLPERMNAYAKENGVVFDGPVYNIYLLDELSVSDPNQYLMQAFAAVTESSRRLSPPLRRRLREGQK